MNDLSPIPLVTTQVDDITDETRFPELAICRAYNRGETPSPVLIARANAFREVRS